MGFSSLYVSVTGLNASKTSLNTVAHNISNTNNPHYVRQSALHSDRYYKTTEAGMQQGTGVGVGQIRQIRDEFLDIQLRRELAKLGSASVRAETLADVEGVFNEITASGLQNVLNDFWNAWDEASKDPELLAARGVLYESAVSFTETVNHISNQLSDLQRNIEIQINSRVDEANKLIDEIAYLNKEIVLAEAEGPGVMANDLRDNRNSLIDRLHSLLPVETREDYTGGTIVTLGGRSLVDGSYVSKVLLKSDPENPTGHKKLAFENKDGFIDLKGQGEIGGLIFIRDESIESYKNKIDRIVESIAENVNKIHREGYSLDGERHNLDFFTAKNGGSLKADTIVVNKELVDLNKIALSKSNKVGDGDIAKEINQLRFNEEIDNMTYDEFYRKILRDLALEREEARKDLLNQDFLIRSIDGKRASLSKVSLDEEMADMLKFQHSYTANSRVFNTIDEMLDTVINRVGIVGR